MTRSVAHLWLDDFFIAVERRHAPPLRGRPLVIGGHRDSAGRVVAASREARACGVDVGQTLRQASRACPAAVFLPGHVERLLDARALVDEALLPLVEGLTWTALDEAVADLGPAGHRAAWKRAEGVQQRAREAAGASVAMGVAGTPTAARAAARRARPDGLVLVLPGYEGRFLAGCEITETEVSDARVVARLRARGVFTFGDVAALADAEAVSLLGRFAWPLLRSARGVDEPAAPRPARARRLVRSGPCRAGSPSNLTACVRQLVDDLRRAMWERGCATHRVGVRLEDGSGGALWDDVSCPAPLVSAEDLWRAASPLVAGLAARMPGAREVVVSVSELEPVDRQASLFGVVSRVLRGAVASPGHGRVAVGARRQDRR
jgi:DNA polymerase-4